MQLLALKGDNTSQEREMAPKAEPHTGQGCFARESESGPYASLLLPAGSLMKSLPCSLRGHLSCSLNPKAISA